MIRETQIIYDKVVFHFTKETYLSYNYYEQSFRDGVNHCVFQPMIFGIFSSLDTDFDTHDLWNEMNEIKEALARERVLLDSKLSQV